MHIREQAEAPQGDHLRGLGDARPAHGVRYAIYFAPRPDSAWWQFGSSWLGRDAVTHLPAAHPAIASFDAATLARITATPRHYGFHATLKAPFRLTSAHTARDVYLQAANLASSCLTAQLPRLSLRTINASLNTSTDGFVALTFAPEQTGAGAAHAIAAHCVSCFDNLRARPDATELARRHAAGLTPHQAHMLAAWGYPYVFDEFRFHMTLTNPLPCEQQAQVISVLSPWIEALNKQPLQLDAISVFIQPAADAPFVVARRYGFDGRVDIYRDDC
jgi:putative phosphonate metabolism protein